MDLFIALLIAYAVIVTIFAAFLVGCLRIANREWRNCLDGWRETIALWKKSDEWWASTVTAVMEKRKPVHN